MQGGCGWRESCCAWQARSYRNAFCFAAMLRMHTLEADVRLRRRPLSTTMPVLALLCLLVTLCVLSVLSCRTHGLSSSPPVILLQGLMRVEPQGQPGMMQEMLRVSTGVNLWLEE